MTHFYPSSAVCGHCVLLGVADAVPLAGAVLVSVGVGVGVGAEGISGRLLQPLPTEPVTANHLWCSGTMSRSHRPLQCKP